MSDIDWDPPTKKIREYLTTWLNYVVRAHNVKVQPAIVEKELDKGSDFRDLRQLFAVEKVTPSQEQISEVLYAILSEAGFIACSEEDAITALDECNFDTLRALWGDENEYYTSEDPNDDDFQRKQKNDDNEVAVGYV